MDKGMVTFFEKVRQHFNFLFLVMVTPCCSTTTEHDKWVVDKKIIDYAFAKTGVEKLTLTKASFTNTIREIGNSFLGAEKATVKELTLALPSLTTIGSDFCSESDSLETVTLNLPALINIGDYFLYLDNKLKEFRLETTKLKEVGDHFLSEASSLKQLNLDLAHLERIGSVFLGGCLALKELTLTLPKVTTIGDLFLSKASSLEQLNLNLPNIEKIGAAFLGECLALKELTLTLPKVTTIGNLFLLETSSLEQLNLNLPNVEKIGTGFLAKCPALKELTLTLPKVTTIGDGFLLTASSLEQLNLNLACLEKIDSRFLEGCTKLKELTLKLPKVTTIGERFLLDASSLEQLNLNLPYVEKISFAFLARCKKLKELTLKLPKVTTIGNSFLAIAWSLEKLTLNLPALEEVGHDFLLGTGLKGAKEGIEWREEFDLKKLKKVGKRFLFNLKVRQAEKLPSSLPNLEEMGPSFFEKFNFPRLALNLEGLKRISSRFLANSKKIKTLTIIAPELTEIEEGFLLNCPSLEEVQLEFPKLVGTSDNCWLEGCLFLKHFSLKAPLLKTITKGFLPESTKLKKLDLSGCTALESADLDLLDKQENSISTLLPSSLKRATSPGKRTTTSASVSTPSYSRTIEERTAEEKISSGYANWILPSTLLLGVGGILCFLYYSQPIKKKRTKKKAKEPEAGPR